MAVLELKGDIIPNEYKWAYDWLGWDSTCPNDAKAVIGALGEGEELTVLVNSGGGDVMSGQELYSQFAAVGSSVAVIQSFAASAAGVAAMGCHTVKMSPVGAIMIHNVQSVASGDFHTMNKASNTLQALDEAMANAYAVKSGKPLDEILEIMDAETWLDANKALAYGFIDEIMTPGPVFTNTLNGMRLTPEILARCEAERAKDASDAQRKKELLGDLDFYGV